VEGKSNEKKKKTAKWIDLRTKITLGVSLEKQKATSNKLCTGVIGPPNIYEIKKCFEENTWEERERKRMTKTIRDTNSRRWFDPTQENKRDELR